MQVGKKKSASVLLILQGQVWAAGQFCIAGPQTQDLTLVLQLFSTGLAQDGRQGRRPKQALAPGAGGGVYKMTSYCWEPCRSELETVLGPGLHANTIGVRSK